ncbi:MAG: ATP synthase subunit I [Pseudomonadales bacterium]
MQLNQPTAQGAQLAKPPLLPIFSAQIIVLLLGSFGLLLIDWVMAYSAFLGGLIAIAPNAYFACRAFQYSGAQAAGDVARSFYRGEAGKFLLTTIMFAGVFALIKPLEVVVIFLTYSVMMAFNWILALRFIKH